MKHPSVTSVLLTATLAACSAVTPPDREPTPSPPATSISAAPPPPIEISVPHTPALRGEPAPPPSSTASVSAPASSSALIWRDAPAVVKGQATAWHWRIRYRTSASLVTLDNNKYGIRLRVEALSNRRDTVRFSCQPLRLSGQRGYISAAKLTWDGGMFGEGGPSMAGWGHQRAELLRSATTLVLERTYPAKPNYQALITGQALQLWVGVESICLHPADQSSNARPPDDMPLATIVVLIPEDSPDPTPKLLIYPGHREIQ